VIFLCEEANQWKLTEEHKRSTYPGHKFEQYITTDNPKVTITVKIPENRISRKLVRFIKVTLLYFFMFREGQRRQFEKNLFKIFDFVVEKSTKIGKKLKIFTKKWYF
jgi:hypothetical protein